MKSSIDLKVYVEVDTKEKYPYRVMCYANGKIFTACKDMMTAKNMCDMINYKTIKIKADYMFLLTFCGYLDYYEWNDPKKLKRVSKTDLIRAYGRVLSAILNPKGCIVGEK